MDNNFSEATTTSFGDNVKSSFLGAILGVLLFLGSFVLLWWNEGNSVRLIKQEDFIHKNAIAVSSTKAERINDSKLIATSGKVITNENLSDSMVTVNDSLNLKREVEMYQWVEKKHTQKKKNAGGSSTQTTTYTYEKRWDRTEHNSDKFKKTGYTNPKFTFESKKLSANGATMGDYKITKEQIEKINAFQEIERLQPVEGFKIYDNYYFKGKDYAMPEVGDLRISYEYVPSGVEVSIIGQQRPDNTIGKKQVGNSSIYLQYDGKYTLDEMLKKFKDTNILLTFGLRIAGFLAMLVGLNLIIGPAIAIARFIPFLSEIISFITSFVLIGISLILTISTIALAWLAYRPLLAILLFAVIGLIIYCIIKHVQNKKA